jgi:hypothetical protein
MPVTYSRRWNFRRNRPIDPLTEDEARALDASGELYTAVLGDPAAPDQVIEVTRGNGHLGTVFFDKNQRQSVLFTFSRADDGKLFLREITRWQYPDDDARTISEATTIEKVGYEPDGIVHREVRDRAANQVTRTDYRDVNLDINWEPEPEFGDWASIARFERDRPASA